MKKRLLFILLLFIAWLPVFVIQKPVFMFYQHALAGDCSFMDYLLVMLHGTKLDCTIAGYLTAVPLLLTLVSTWLPGNWLKKVLKGYYLFTGLLVAAIFAVDVALYGFWGFRIDATLFFYLQSPTDAMASVPIGLAILQSLVFVIYASGIYAWFRWLLRFAPGKDSTAPTFGKRMGTSLAIILLGGILFIPIRGSVTTSTANVGMVYFSQNQFLNHSAINPCFSLFASLSKQQDFASQFNFFPETEREALFSTLIHNPSSTPQTDSIPNASKRLLTTDRPNILLIILESFTANAIEAVGGEPGITPRLNKLCEEGILFTNLYANSFRTDRGLVAILNGYLAQPTTSIMKYPAKSQTLPSIAKSLRKEGYNTDMLYGGDINFTNMQSYFYSTGYNRITADRDFPLTSRLSKWGANDDITFSHLYEEIKSRPTDSQPWLSTFLTLSSHEPFEVPYHHLEHPYLNSVAFTDSCVGDFIDRFKQLPAWKNTLIIFIADHGYRYPDNLNEFEPRRYHIPMLWIGGAITSPRKIDTYANQTDLAATLMNQLGLSTKDFIFSKDILDPNDPHYAFYTFNNGFGFIDTSGISVYDNEGNRILLESPSEGSEERIRKGKALLQTLYDDLGAR